MFKLATYGVDDHRCVTAKQDAVVGLENQIMKSYPWCVELVSLYWTEAILPILMSNQKMLICAVLSYKHHILSFNVENFECTTCCI